MKKAILIFLCLILSLAHFPLMLMAESVNDQPDKLPELDVVPNSGNSDFSLGCDGSEMLYGIPTAEYNGITYGFSDKKLYALSDNGAIPILNQDGDNINLVENMIYFTTYENEKAFIKSYNLSDGTLSTVMYAGESMIFYFYVVNSNTLMYLSNGIVYQAMLGSLSAQRISPMKNICSFLPTNIGILYGTGIGCDCTLYLDNTFLLDNVRSYGIEDDHLVVTAQDVLYQIPMEKLPSFCALTVTNSAVRKASLLPYLEQYNLHGTVNIAELLNIDNLDPHCDYCDGAESELDTPAEPCIVFTRSRESVPMKPADLSGGNYKTMIISQADKLLNYKWTPLSNIPKYNGQNSYFTAGTTYTGIPYSIGTHFENTGFTNRVITYVKPGSSGSSFTLSQFGAEVNNSNSLLYSAATECPDAGPLYGAYCSAFVSFAWGLTTRGTGLLPECATAIQINSLSSLNNLAVGDSLIRQKSGSVSGHAILIYDIQYNSSGTITNITVAEETPPETRTVTYSRSSFYSKYCSATGFCGYRPQYYIITFNANGGTTPISSMSAIADVKMSAGAALPTPVREGYTFTGWSKTIGGSSFTSSSYISGNTTLYANWIIETVAPNSLSCTNSSIVTDTERVLTILEKMKENYYEH